MTHYDYDLVVIGSGPAGEKGATEAGYYGKKVALVEREKFLGGTGINTGTVPSKTLRETALYYSGLNQRGIYGIDYSLREHMTVGDFMYHERAVVGQERSQVRRGLERCHVEIVKGEGRLKDAHTVHVIGHDSQEMDLHTDVILIATGSSPYQVKGVPFDGQRVFDSDSILHMGFIPRTMLVVGGGIIGCEYASIFAALNVQVTLIERGARLLPFLDHEIGDRLSAQLARLNMRLLFNQVVNKTEVVDDHVQLSLENAEKLVGDCVLFATGRQSNVEVLGLEALGVKLGQRGLILVNDSYQTNIPNIYAAGDVIGFPALASTSMEQARIAVDHAFNLPPDERLPSILPLAVYTVPEISIVGQTEQECQQKNIPYLVGRSHYDKSPRGQIIGDLAGMVKLVFSPADKTLLGVHHIGELASELIHIGSHVIAEGGTIDTFINAVYNYPTLADSYKYAAYDGLGNWEQWQAENPQSRGKPSKKKPK